MDNRLCIIESTNFLFVIMQYRQLELELIDWDVVIFADR